MSTGQEQPTRPATVQESNGCKRVTIPAEVAEEAGVGDGDVVLLRPSEGGEIRIRRAEDAWSDE